MQKKWIQCLLAFLACLIISGNIWFWKDDQGVRHYSNVQPPKGKSFQKIEESRKITKQLNQKKNKGYQFHVLKVFDGDTVQVKGLGLKFTIRLAGIDSPEKGYDGRPGQPYSQKAKKYLTDLVRDKKITLKSYGSGGYNRQLAEIFLDGENINLQMIAAGLAEVYSGRLPKALDSRSYFKAQAIARKMSKGMWVMGASYKSPKLWRKEHPRK